MLFQTTSEMNYTIARKMCYPLRDSREQSCESITTIGKESKTTGISQGKTILPSIMYLSYLDQNPELLGVRKR